MYIIECNMRNGDTQVMSYCFRTCERAVQYAKNLIGDTKHAHVAIDGYNKSELKITEQRNMFPEAGDKRPHATGYELVAEHGTYEDVLDYAHVLYLEVKD